MIVTPSSSNSPNSLLCSLNYVTINERNSQCSPSMSIAYLAYVADVSVIWNAKRQPEIAWKLTHFTWSKPKKPGWGAAWVSYSSGASTRFFFGAKKKLDWQSNSDPSQHPAKVRFGLYCNGLIYKSIISYTTKYE